MLEFFLSVTPGKNTFMRKSTEASMTIPDIPSFSKLIHDADAAVAGGAELNQLEHSRSCGLPNRMLLPKGTSEGMEFALAVAITDAHEDAAYALMEAQDHQSHGQCGIHGEKYPDHLPMGFPLDRKISDERVFLQADNIKYNIVKVFHKESDHLH